MAEQRRLFNALDGWLIETACQLLAIRYATF